MFPSIQALNHRPGASLGIRLLHPREHEGDGVALAFHFLKLAGRLVVHGVGHQRYASLRCITLVTSIRPYATAKLTRHSTTRKRYPERVPRRATTSWRESYGAAA
jgi:hypothetical protein